MKNQTAHGITQVLRRTVLVIICGFFVSSGAYAQGGSGSSGAGGSCTVTNLRLRIATSDDDLRGGQDNLNIVVYFNGGAYQIASNVNHSQNWPNNSVNMVDIPLNRPTPPNELRSFRLVHIADGGFNISNLPALATPAAPIVIAQSFQSPDNWNMADIEVAAIGNGVGARIANYGFHRFTGSAPDLIIPFHVPANICSSGRPTSGADGRLLDPAGSALRPVSSPNGALTNEDVTRMTQAGVPESAIIASIRSKPANFDTSTSALAKLRQTGVGENVLKEMQKPGANPDNNPKATIARTGNGEKNADELSPQPYPPKGTSSQNATAQNSGASAKFALPPNLKVFKVGEARNPVALTALREASLVNGNSGGNIGPERTMSATGSTPSNTIAAVPARNAAVPSGATAMQPSGTVNPRVGLTATATGLCLNRATIAAVNGQQPNFAQFTPGTRYVITGCGFGSTPGKVYLTGGFPAHNGQVALGPYFAFGTQRSWSGHWSDREIDAQLDEGLSGEMDQFTNISLVVETSDGQRIQAGVLSFKAQRAEFMLGSIPSSAIGSTPRGTALSPCTSSWVTGDCTVDVLRATGAPEEFNPSPDTFTINLKSGFILSRVVLMVMSQTQVTEWTAPQMNGNQINVIWHWFAGPGEYRYSLYGLQIYVVGPLGVTNACEGQ